MKLRENENFAVLGLFLAATALLSAALLGIFTDLVKDPIAAAEKARQRAGLRLVLGEFDNDPSEETFNLNGIKFMAARKNGSLTGTAVEISGPGYGGDITLLIGIKISDGTVNRVLVMEQHETPGLGAEVCLRKTKKTVFNLGQQTNAAVPGNPLLDQFNGENGSRNWKIVKDGGDFQFKTGATVTSRAVTELTGIAVNIFAKQRQTVIAGLESCNSTVETKL